MSTKITVKTGKENYRTVVISDSHRFVADEPIQAGGKDLGPNPGELLAASLATCTAITMKMYADRKGWSLNEIVVEVDFEWNRKENFTVFTKSIQIDGNLDAEQRDKLMEIGGKCPIHRTLNGSIEVKQNLME